MQGVMLALLPGTLVSVMMFGYAIIINLAFSIVAALVIEAMALLLRKKPVLSTLADGTAILTAWLFALALPALTPWWVTVTGVAAAMLLGKHVYGGVGNNPFNPAMLGYAFVLISFPREVTAWTAPDWFHTRSPDFIQSLTTTINPTAHTHDGWDAITMATPLDRLKQQSMTSLEDLSSQQLHGFIGAYGWEWINLAFLLGGLWMLQKRMISWHIPFSLLATLALCYSIAWIIPGGQHLSPFYGLFSGAAMLGAFFIATDPVSAATSNTGKLVFGAGIGLLTYFIREFGGYPEGIAFAVLLMNMSAPTIDYYCRPRAT